MYITCWGHGDVRQYDITDTANPKLVGQVRHLHQCVCMMVNFISYRSRAQTIIRIFGLIFVWVIFEYQFPDQLFACYNFVHFW